MGNQTPSALTVLGICGSLSPDSSTFNMLQLALEGAANEGALVTMLDLRDLELPFCDGRDDYATYPPNVQRLRHAVHGAHGIILASPEYHNSLSGVLKNALDLVTAHDIAGKMCGLIGVAGGGHGAINTLNTLRIICRGLGAWVVPQQISISHIDAAFDEHGVLRDPTLAKRVGHLGATVAINARLHHPSVTIQQP